MDVVCRFGGRRVGKARTGVWISRDVLCTRAKEIQLWALQLVKDAKNLEFHLRTIENHLVIIENKMDEVVKLVKIFGVMIIIIHVSKIIV